jgi:hypothetical protein
MPPLASLGRLLPLESIISALEEMEDLARQFASAE